MMTIMQLFWSFCQIGFTSFAGCPRLLSLQMDREIIGIGPVTLDATHEGLMGFKLCCYFRFAP